ncbi:DUF6167 family protein [Nocardiopsis sp. NPDC007018]|uniref:DUF6167 family protein n=1 Tax=Nocardiopsis sp. NPDC007018 TaxID=3155721 RepID=UPI0033E7FD2E
MIGRLFYLAAGAAIGGYAVHRAHRARRAMTPGGIADRVEDRVVEYRGALQELNEDLAEAVREEEAQLLRRYAPSPRLERSEDPPRRGLPGRE